MAKVKSTAGDFSDSAHRVWLAGLGALATAGKEGEKLFSTLVNRGKTLEKQLNVPVERAGKRVRSTVGGARTRAGKTLREVQDALDHQVNSALHRLGVPTRNEIASLSARVEKLTKAMNGKKVTKKKAARKKVTKKKVTKKKTAKRATKKAPRRRTTR